MKYRILFDFNMMKRTMEAFLFVLVNFADATDETKFPFLPYCNLIYFSSHFSTYPLRTLYGCMFAETNRKF